MKFIHYLSDIAGIEMYPMVSFMIFFIFFIGLFAYVIKADKKYITAMKQLPLDGDENE